MLLIFRITVPCLSNRWWTERLMHCRRKSRNRWELQVMRFKSEPQKLFQIVLPGGSPLVVASDSSSRGDQSFHQEVLPPPHFLALRSGSVDRSHRRCYQKRWKVLLFSHIWWVINDNIYCLHLSNNNSNSNNIYNDNCWHLKNHHKFLWFSAPKSSRVSLTEITGMVNADKVTETIICRQL